MTHDALRLTAYFGERDRAGRAFLAEALLDVFERHGVHAAVLLRGAEGFGLKQRLRAERLLTLSEDLPVVAMALDEPGSIQAVLGEVAERFGDGLLTLERVRRVDEGFDPGPGEARLTIGCGRHERAGRRPAHLAAVDALRRHGVDGATVLLGVDGVVRGTRRRARMLAANRDVPELIVSIGAEQRLAAALDEVRASLRDPVLTLERVTVCKRGGTLLATPPALPPGRGLWRKLTVYAGEEARAGGRPLAPGLLRRLRAEGAAGATTLHGVWGYHGDHAPHGERLLALRRRVPAVLTVVDDPVRAERWFELIDEATADGGLVTAEIVPALRASAGTTAEGGLALAALVE